MLSDRNSLVVDRWLYENDFKVQNDGKQDSFKILVGNF